MCRQTLASAASGECQFALSCHQTTRQLAGNHTQNYDGILLNILENSRYRPSRRGAANAQINCKNHACLLQIRAQKARRDSQPGCRMCVCRCVGRMRFKSLRNTKKRCSGCSRSSNHWSPGHPLIAAKMQSGDDFGRGKSAQQTVQVEDRNQRQCHLGLGAGHMGHGAEDQRSTLPQCFCIESINGAMSKHHAPGNVR